MDKEVQIMLGDKIIRVFAEPSELFLIINGIMLQHRTPQVRYFDEELNDWTCWQPTQPSERKVA